MWHLLFEDSYVTFCLVLWRSFNSFISVLVKMWRMRHRRDQAECPKGNVLSTEGCRNRMDRVSKVSKITILLQTQHSPAPIFEPWENRLPSHSSLWAPVCLLSSFLLFPLSHQFTPISLCPQLHFSRSSEKTPQFSTEFAQSFFYDITHLTYQLFFPFFLSCL